MPDGLDASDAHGATTGPRESDTPDAAHSEAAGTAGNDFEVTATSPPTSTDPFRVVAVTWDDGDVEVRDVSAWVRHRADGSWSAWHPLPTAEDHGPDPDSTERNASRDGTGALFVPESNGVQVRVDTLNGVNVDDLRVDLIDPGTSPADAAPGAAAPGAAAAATPEPAIYSRADWGADESIRERTVEYGQIQAAFVHHTVNSNDYAKADVPAILRGIYAYHVKSRGWRDIGYNFLIDKWGRIWEGRYGGIDKPVIGAHTSRHNDDAFGVSAIGTYTDTRPTTETLDSFSRLIAWKFSLHGVDALSSASLDGEVVRTISGHRDTYATACPGDQLYGQLPQIRQAAQAYAARSVAVSDLPTTTALGSRVQLTVTTRPPQRDTEVLLQRRLVGTSAWKTPQRRTLDRSGTYPFSINPGAAGTYEIRAVVLTTPALISRSQRLSVTDRDVFPRPPDGTYLIVGHGWGHGRGLSQWGALEAASRGRSEREINAFYYPGTARSTAGGNPVIRVLLTADTGSDVIIRPEPGLTIRYTDQSGRVRFSRLPTDVGGCAPRWWRVLAIDGDLRVEYLCGSGYRTWRSTSSVDGDSPVVFSPTDGRVAMARRLASGFERRSYRGDIEVHRRGRAVAAVNAVRMQAYLRSVVPSEMPSNWPSEALRAQAVAARTYALREAADRAGYFDVYDTVASQVYRGSLLYDDSWRTVRSFEAASTDAAVSGTSGLHLRYGTGPAFAQFSSSNGGVTAAGTDPYLPARLDAWDRASKGNSRLNWTDTVDVGALENRYPQIGRLQRVRVLGREGIGDWGGRVTSLAIDGSAGRIVIAGDSAVRSTLGTNSNYLTFR